MSDPIDRQAAIDAIRDHKRNVLGQREWDEGIAFGYSAAHEHICDIIKTLPTIDERKKGEWIGEPKDGIEAMFFKPKCSECGFESADGKNYCPDCGSFNGGAK